MKNCLTKQRNQMFSQRNWSTSFCRAWPTAAFPLSTGPLRLYLWSRRVCSAETGLQTKSAERFIPYTLSSSFCRKPFSNMLWRLIGRIKKWQLTPWNFLNLRTCGTLLQGVTRNSHNLFPAVLSGWKWKFCHLVWWSELRSRFLLKCRPAVRRK